MASEKQNCTYPLPLLEGKGRNLFIPHPLAKAQSKIPPKGPNHVFPLPVDIAGSWERGLGEIVYNVRKYNCLI